MQSPDYLTFENWKLPFSLKFQLGKNSIGGLCIQTMWIWSLQLQEFNRIAVCP